MSLRFIDDETPKCKRVCHGYRLKFTVVSEPIDDDEECVDVGHAFLDLQELLLTGNDVIDQQIDSKCCICPPSVSIEDTFLNPFWDNMSVFSVCLCVCFFQS